MLWSPNCHAGKADSPTVHPYLSEPLPRALAHRGWHIGDLAGMENSLSAFRRAVAEGYRYIETDVHATVDGVVVVQHDHSLDRTTDGSGIVADLPWSAVAQARVGGREPVAALADVLEDLPETRFNIDVKADTAVEPMLSLLRRMDAWDRVCLASFSDRRLARLRKAAGPQLVTSMGPRSVLPLWLAGRCTWLPVRGWARGAIAQVPRRSGSLTVVDHRFVQSAHRAGVEVHVWTVDDETEMTELLELGVDGLVTDRPDVLRDLLAERGAWPVR